MPRAAIGVRALPVLLLSAVAWTMPLDAQQQGVVVLVFGELGDTLAWSEVPPAFQPTDSVLSRQVLLPRSFAFDSLRPYVGMDLQLELGMGRPSVSLMLTDVTRVSDTSYTMTGFPIGVGSGSAVFRVSGAALSARIRLPNAVYMIDPVESGEVVRHVIRLLDPRRPMPPEPPRVLPPSRPPPREEGRPGRVMRMLTGPGQCSDTMDMAAGRAPEVRVLLLYTPEAAAAVGAIDLYLQTAVDEVNLALATSRIEAVVSVAWVMEVRPGLQESGVHDLDLAALSDAALGWVHATRDELSADVVVLVTETATGCGLTYLPSGVGHENESLAFVVVNRGCLGEQLGLAHELGHVLGAGHERSGQVLVNAMEVFDYSHGLYDQVRGWKTIMAYNVCSACELLARFSNPYQYFDGTYLGFPSGHPDAADNHRAIGNVAAVAAAYRLTPVRLVSAGGTEPWQELWSGPLPWPDLQAGDLAFAQLGFGDFDGDGITDVVHFGANGWYVWDGGANPWRELAPPGVKASLPPAGEFAIGNFDGVGPDDVLYSGGGGTWSLLITGDQDWKAPWTGASLDSPLRDLRFYDFDGDGTTDIFRVRGGAWFLLDPVSLIWQVLNNQAPDLPVEELGFADLDGDNAIDVLWSDGTGALFWSRKGSLPPQRLHPSGFPSMREMRLGDFDGDGQADFLRANPQHTAWLMAFSKQRASWGLDPWVEVRASCLTMDDLAVADFNGDHVSDVFRIGVRP